MKLIGNKDIVQQLRIAVASAKADNRPLPHTLLSGAAGCGKTSTSKGIAMLMGTQFIALAPETIKTREDVISLAKMLKKRDVRGYDIYGNKVGDIYPPIIFIDEIHGMSISGQEHLGILMENWTIAVDANKANVSPYDQFGTNPNGRVKWSPQFTIVGATTNDGLLTKPFKDRFKLRFIFHTYDMEDSIEIVRVHANRMGLKLDEEVPKLIAMRGKGTPRIMVGYLERCRDYAQALNLDTIDQAVVEHTFELMGIDSTGLGPIEQKLMKILYDNRDQPVGLDNLSIVLNENKQTLANTVEPYLMQRGLITRTSRGRTLTNAGLEYLRRAGYIEVEDDFDIDIPANYERRL